MARKRADDYGQQRDAILAKAERAFAGGGFPSSSMASLAKDCGTSKARLYHYYESKEAMLFELLDRITRKLLAITAKVRVDAEGHGLAARQELRELIRAYLDEYRTSRFRHAALLNDVRHLAPAQRERILAQERDVVARLAEVLQRAFPDQVGERNVKPLTMMLFGMINWTSTWMNPEGPMSCAEFADHVTAVVSSGIAGLPAIPPTVNEAGARR